MKYQWPNLRHNHSILLEERRKTRNIFSGSAKAERFGKSTFRIKFRRVAVPSNMFFFKLDMLQPGTTRTNEKLCG
jgi:hypothetical protein